MALNDIFQIKLSGSYLGQAILNVFYYRQTTNDVVGVGTVAELMTRFNTVVVTEILTGMSDEYHIDQFEVIGLRLPATYFGTTIVNADGGLSALGAPSPAWLAVSYRYSRVAPGQRYGYKRFPAPPGDFIDGNSTIAAYQSSYGDPLATDLGVDLASMGLNFTPFVASRPTPLGANPSGYDPTAVLYRGLTSQNTRKV